MPEIREKGMKGEKERERKRRRGKIDTEREKVMKRKETPGEKKE